MPIHYDFDDEFASPRDFAQLYRHFGLQVVPAFMPKERTEWKRPIFTTWKRLSQEPMNDSDFDELYGCRGIYITRQNMGILTGRCSNGMFVLDLDSHKNSIASIWFDGLLQEYNNGKPLETPTQTTGGGGKQLLFRAPLHWLAPTSKRSDLGIDIRGEGGFAMMPPSLHESGRCYGWDDDLAPNEVPIKDAPEWLLAELDKLFCPHRNPTNNFGATTSDYKQKKTGSKTCEDIFGQKIDGREEYMKSLVCARMTSIYRAGSPRPTDAELHLIFDDLRAQYESKVEPRYDDPRLDKRELLEREGRGPSLMWKKLRYLRDRWDTKVAELAAEQRGPSASRDREYSEEAREKEGSNANSPSSKSKRNTQKNKPDHLALALKTIENIGRENIVADASGIWKWDTKGVWKTSCDDEIKKNIHQALSDLDQPVMAAMTNGILQVLKTEIYAPCHKFNLGNPEVANCINGELELSGVEWRLVPHRRATFRTTQIPVAYDADADAPRFLQFLEEIWRDDSDKSLKIRGLLEMIGYTLMSHARHERFIILIGAGANGKSVLLAILQGLLGEANVAAVQPSNFDRAFQRAHLDQKLANIITEIAQGEMIADAELKAITSGEPSTVEHKYGAPFVMHPFATCWFGTNHMPRTKDFSDALFRRALIITFNRVFMRSEQDPMLKERLQEELPGILKMALQAYAKALVSGFTEPPSSDAAKQEWRREVDQVAQFIDECCQADPKAEVKFKDLFHRYKGWAVDQGIRLRVEQRGFRDRLSRLGFGNRRDRRCRYVTGLELTDVAFDEDDFG